MSRHSRIRLLRFPQVEARTGLSRAEIFRRIIAKPPRFPLPIKCGRSSHFVESEVSEWIAQQVALRDAAIAGPSLDGVGAVAHDEAVAVLADLRSAGAAFDTPGGDA